MSKVQKPVEIPSIQELNACVSTAGRRKGKSWRSWLFDNQIGMNFLQEVEMMIADGLPPWSKLLYTYALPEISERKASECQKSGAPFFLPIRIIVY